ncbi:MAG TPA: hypothetical protein VF411_00890, partial [Bacteroidia bacterium]
HIYFNKVPKNGIYTCNGGNALSQVSVAVNGNFVNGGGSVYVAQNTNSTTTVSFCSLTYNNGSFNVTASAKLTF